MPSRDLSGLWWLKIPFPFFYPKSHIHSYNSSCIHVYMCVCIHTHVLSVCLWRTKLGLSFFRNGNFILSVLRFFQYCHTVCMQKVPVHFRLTECVLDTLFLLESILFQKEKYFCKVLFSYYIIWFIRLSSFLPSESEFESWLQNLRFYKWVKSETLTLFFFFKFCQLTFWLNGFRTNCEGNLRCRRYHSSWTV